MQLIANVLGWLGVGANVLIYQQNTRTRLLVFKLISDILWGVHYYLIGATSGVAIACIAICRECTFIKVDKKSKLGKACLGLFVVVAIVSAIVTWKSTVSLLPATASVISVVGFYIGIPNLSRWLSFAVSACMCTYDAFSGSIPGIINEVLTVASSITALIMVYLKSRKEGAING